jgi:CBS domain containing-hemolysin-like protein
MEDILEELVGEIQDEHDEESSGVEQMGEGTYVVNATMSIADANELMTECKLPEGESYTTISGLVNKWFERIPEVNESVERDSIRMTVLKTDSHRVVQVKIEDTHHQVGDE